MCTDSHLSCRVLLSQLPSLSHRDTFVYTHSCIPVCILYTNRAVAVISHADVIAFHYRQLTESVVMWPRASAAPSIKPPGSARLSCPSTWPVLAGPSLSAVAWSGVTPINANIRIHGNSAGDDELVHSEECVAGGGRWRGRVAPVGGVQHPVSPVLCLPRHVLLSDSGSSVLPSRHRIRLYRCQRRGHQRDDYSTGPVGVSDAESAWLLW